MKKGSVKRRLVSNLKLRKAHGAHSLPHVPCAGPKDQLSVGLFFCQIANDRKLPHLSLVRF